MTKLDPQRADELVRRLSQGDGFGGEQYELLQQVLAGYPVTRLGPMVNATEISAVRCAASIFSEAGGSVSSATELVDTLLVHSDEKVRYYTIQAVLASGSPDLASQAAKALRMIEDSSAAVRRSAIRFLAYAPAEQLQAARAFLDSEWQGRVSALLGDPVELPPRASGMKDGPSQVELMVSLAGALRIASSDPAALEAAAMSSNLEIRGLAIRELEIARRIRSSRT